MDLSLYSRFGASRIPLLMTMSIRRFLSEVNSSPLSTWCGISCRFNVREIAWRSGWCWFICASALGQMRACLVSTSNSSQQGYLIATCSSIPMKRLPMPTKSAARMTRSESVGLDRRHAVPPAPCRLLYRALARALVSPPPSGSSGPGGRTVSGSCPSMAIWEAYLPWLTILPIFCWAFLWW